MFMVRQLARLELRQILRARMLPWLLALYVLAGVAAVLGGVERVERERAVLADREPFLREQAAYLKKKHPENDLGILAYHIALPTEQAANPWTALATGLRDVHPFSQHLRVLGLVPQAYASELGSPLAQLTGSFDYAFVVTFLLPLLVIALGYDVASRDEALGTDLLLRSQPVSRARIVGLRLLLRAVIVFATVLVLFALTLVIARLPLDARVAWWLLVQLAYVTFWSGCVWLVATLGRSSGYNAIALMGMWIALCVLLPAAANALLMTSPTESGVALTLKQRELLNAGWDKPKRETMEPFWQRRGQTFRQVEVPEHEFSWSWYYANQEQSDVAVASEVAAYQGALLARESHTQQLATMLPPLAVQRALTHLAGTDLTARLGYQASVAAYHEQLKLFFYPLVFAETGISRVNLDALPRHRFEHAPKKPALLELSGLIALGLLGLLLGARWSRRLDATI